MINRAEEIASDIIGRLQKHPEYMVTYKTAFGFDVLAIFEDNQIKYKFTSVPNEITKELQDIFDGVNAILSKKQGNNQIKQKKQSIYKYKKNK